MTTPARPRTLTARCPEDLLAVARVVLGFEPDDSVVMLTVGAGESFHARVDLPRGDPDLDEVVELLTEPAARHRVDATVLLVYTDDARLARRTARRLRRALRGEGVGVIDALRVDDGRWYPLFRDRDGLGASGVPYDVSAHPFVAQAVLEGRVLHGSRRELAASLGPVPDEVARVTGARPCAAASQTWVAELLAHHLEAGTVPGPGDAARLLEAIAEPRVRDVAWCGMRRDTAREETRLWADLVRRAPDDLVAHPASVLAFAAWLAGDGALAWCAVDRACEADPTHSLADLVAGLLTSAVPPGEWERSLAAKRSAS